MITIEKLKCFREVLEEITIQTDELLKVRPINKLFTNSDDYYQALKTCEYCPQDYYHARFFDTNITLMFNRRNKKFYINFDTLKTEYLNKLSFLEFVSENKLINDGIRRYNYFIPQDYSFEKIVNIFYKITKLFCDLYLVEDEGKLFIYQ